MRSEFEKNRYWIGLFKTDVEFNGLLGEFGRYELNGSRDVNHSYLEDFNSKWEAYANAWKHQQSKVEELTQLYAKELFNKKVVANKAAKQIVELQVKNDDLQKQLNERDLRIKRLIESEENIARGCEDWRNAHRKADEKVDELQKQLIDQGQRFNEQAQRVRDLEHKNGDLKNRVDAAHDTLTELKEKSDALHHRWHIFSDSLALAEAEMIDMCVKELEQALKGGEDASN